MMELTTRIGTAKATFHDKRGQRLLPVDVAGKTGTLYAETDRGYVGYSWFVGYAPADHPRSPSRSRSATPRAGASRRPTSGDASSPSTSPASAEKNDRAADLAACYAAPPRSATCSAAAPPAGALWPLTVARID